MIHFCPDSWICFVHLHDDVSVAGSGLSHITATARVTVSHQPTLDIVIPAHGESWSREEFQIFVRYVKKVGVSSV